MNWRFAGGVLTGLAAVATARWLMTRGPVHEHTITVAVPEWCGAVKIRMLTPADIDAYLHEAARIRAAERLAGYDLSGDRIH